MSDLAALNKSVSLSSASHDFVLLAKSLAAARGGISETQQLARTAPSMRVREVLSDLKAAVNADVVVRQLGAGAVSSKWPPDFLVASARFPHSRRFTTSVIFRECHLRTRVVILTTAPVAEAVSELAAKSVSSGSFASAQLETQKVAEFLVISVTSWRKRLRLQASACSATSCVVPAVLPSIPSSSH